MNATSVRPVTRWRAAGVHLALSAILALLAGLLLFGVWYPSPYTKAAGADRLIMLLIGIDLVLGPLLTLIVYKQGKKGMWFDLIFIGAVQLAALIYGMVMIAQSRPIFIVLSDDMTFLVANRSISDADLATAPDPSLRTRSWTGPIYVAAPAPTDPKEREDLLFSSMVGKDIDRQPKYFRPLASAGPALISASTPLSQLAAIPGARTAVDQFVAAHEIPIERLRFQPLRGRDPEQDSTIVYDTSDSKMVGVIQLDPWVALPKDEG